MNALAREVLQLARRNPNELVSKRYLLLRQLRQNRQYINSSLTALVKLYRAAALYDRWGRDFMHVLNQQSQLHCWQLAYWRLRANLNNKLQWNASVSEFIAHIQERHLLADDIVLLSELVRYFGRDFQLFDSHKSIQRLICSLVLQHFHELSAKQRERLVVNLRQANNEEAEELLVEIKKILLAELRNRLGISQHQPLEPLVQHPANIPDQNRSD